jgi:hypothetical protein
MRRFFARSVVLGLVVHLGVVAPASGASQAWQVTLSSQERNGSALLGESA